MKDKVKKFEASSWNVALGALPEDHSPALVPHPFEVPFDGIREYPPADVEDALEWASSTSSGKKVLNSIKKVLRELGIKEAPKGRPGGGLREFIIREVLRRVFRVRRGMDLPGDMGRQLETIRRISILTELAIAQVL